MASARDILDERLARGEITLQEHQTLAERMRDTSAQAAPARLISNAPDVSPSQSGTGSILWNGLGVVVAIVWIGLTNNVVNDIIATCIQRGSSAGVCQTSGVNWPMVYASYLIALAVGASSAFALFRHKLFGSAGVSPR